LDRSIERLLSRLEKVTEKSKGQYAALCPAHDDKNPSLSVTAKDDRILIHCFAGCDVEEVLASVNLSLSDLFDKPLTHRGKPIPKRDRWDARMLLREIRDESVVVVLAATDMLQQKTLPPEDYKRLRKAADRIADIAGMVV
jgi:hypothetical protein